MVARRCRRSPREDIEAYFASADPDLAFEQETEKEKS